MKALLFDLDGTLLDTEAYYTEFWDRAGLNYLGIENFATIVKGQTLDKISVYFSDKSAMDRVRDEINVFESKIQYRYIKGAKEFLESIKANTSSQDEHKTTISQDKYKTTTSQDECKATTAQDEYKTAIVTSSNELKMSNVYTAFPEFKEYFDLVVTANDFKNSKPDPECFLLAMEKLAVKPSECIIFEDSIHGLQAARQTGARVVALATTNPRDVLAGMADCVIDDFTGFSVNDL